MGYKEFGAELLLAADVNEYLMRQAVIRVANALERDAIPSPEPGMVVWRDDGARLESWTGTQWRTVWLDTGWVDLELRNGWARVSTRTPQVRRVGATVYLRGQVSGGTAGELATLPAMFAPADQTISLIVPTGTTTTSVTINTSGVVTIGATGTSPWLNESWLAS